MNSALPYALHRLVFRMDATADKLLREQYSISYKRAFFLLMLHEHGTLTQHELALALGYSDPAVSTMLLELVKEGYAVVESSPSHGRKRLVTLTPKGAKIIEDGVGMLEAHFEKAIVQAGIDAKSYQQATDKLYAIITKQQKDEQ